MARRSTGIVLSVVIASLGCAGDYYDRYRDAHPGWVAVGPSNGLGLEELIASLHAPPLADVRTLVLKLAIYRTDVEPWEEFDLAALESGALAPSREHHYAVILTTSCQSTEQLESHRAVQTSWYLLPHDQLAFWDHWDFVDRCVFANEFQPATPAFVDEERALVERAKSAPQSTLMSANQTYRKGILLALVGRAEDAESMLALGDAEERTGGERGGHLRFDGPVDFSLEQPGYRAKLRAELVEAIAAAKTGVRH